MAVCTVKEGDTKIYAAWKGIVALPNGSKVFVKIGLACISTTYIFPTALRRNWSSRVFHVIGSGAYKFNFFWHKKTMTPFIQGG